MLLLIITNQLAGHDIGGLCQYFTGNIKVAGPFGMRSKVMGHLPGQTGKFVQIFGLGQLAYNKQHITFLMPYYIGCGDHPHRLPSSAIDNRKMVDVTLRHQRHGIKHSAVLNNHGRFFCHDRFDRQTNIQAGGYYPVT